MNHYPHHIGDFNNATRHLTRVERSLYRDLLDLYYDTEQPLPAGDIDWLARRVLAHTDTEKAALQAVLGEFFVLDGDVYRQARCDQEINKYQSLISNASKAGKASAERRRNIRSTPVKQPLNERATNQNQNQNQNQGTPPPGGAKPDPVKDEIWKTGRQLLTGEGKSRDAAGSFLGKLCKDYGQVLVLDAVRDCVKATPAKPSEWLMARCQERRANSGNKQAAQEKRNRVAVSGWVPPELREPKHAAG